MCLVAWPSNESEAGVDIVLINLFAILILMMLSSCKLMGIYIRKAVPTPASLSFKGQASKYNFKMVYSKVHIVNWFIH